MGDIFKEQMIKKLPSTKDMVLKALIIAATVILVLAGFLFIPSIAPLLAAGVIFLAYYGIGMQNIEYEYIYTNGELDIDCIYAKSRRKRMFSADVKEFDIMTHVEDKEHIRDFDSAEVVKDYSSGKVTENTYAFLYTYKGKRTKFIIEPNDTILKAFGMAIPRRKFFTKPGSSVGNRPAAVTPESLMAPPPSPENED